MSQPPKWVCDQGDGTFDHDWRWSHDFIGDGDVPNGTQRIVFRVCRACGVEDHEPETGEEPQEPEDQP